MPARPSPVLFAALAGALALSAAVGPAHAQSPAEINQAKQHAGEGLGAYQAGEYDKALALFSEARRIYPSAQILRMLGYSELALEHWLKAMEALEAALDSKITPLSRDDRKEVGDQLAKAAAHVGMLNVTTKVPGARLTVDTNDPVSLPLEKPLRVVEGMHKVVVTAPDRVDATADVKVEGGKPLDVPMEPREKAKPPPPPPPPPPVPPKPERREIVPQQRLVGMAVAGAGVASGIAALVTIIEAGHWRSMANADVATHLKYYGQGCAMGDYRLCSYDISVTNQEADTADKLRNAAIGLGVTAAVLAGGGVALFVLAPKPRAQAGAPDSAPPSPQAGPVSLRCGAGGGLGLFCTGAF